MALERIVIIGVGGFGRETAFLVEEINRRRFLWRIEGFLDEDPAVHGRIVNGYPVLGGLDWYASNRDAATACAIGDPGARKRVAEALARFGARFPILIHPGVICYPSNSLGEGTIIHPGNILNVDVTIGHFACFEMGSTIGHDVVLEDFVSVMPGVNVAGNVTIGEGAYLGTGCTIIQGLRIGEWSIVGAGSVVIEDVPPYSTVVGVPARVIKTHQPPE